MRIGFIGVGKMASAIITGLKTTEHELIISGSSLARSQEIAKQLHVDFAQSHEGLLDQADLVILGIKPQLFEAVLTPLTFKQPVLSMAAGITLERLAQLTSPELSLIRLMPNINAQQLAISTAICANDKVASDLLDVTKEICNSFRATFEIAEKDFDTFTALAGSSPAYIALFIEALAKAGVKNGFPKSLALNIVAQTVQATAQTILSGPDSPHDLIDKICSPGGTTIAGLMELERLGMTHATSSAIDQTIEKAKTL
ncbi:TPA: pyrroline-5-carboxylate reductase [Streptococcus suis]|uniref:Pyrroline-5-carboxylate reductase n=1 Tax=Streptococcus suis TaxID=1307 RepID=A0A0Z8H3A6_STRSU|nr:pyrroline-5-carboxylate reductase [Streptococcus suis]MDW8749836.1 pyrroline-5-carboxylate reductase [Streptococcus suis]NQH24131.1 pyrroline-5-carboxylate reductase [Streptococcus suis]NQH64625.1 pyrroline-5-carboxylate reductase [Streptococcus suis]NQN39076.1 pyrroline-5-carboxylate reductase [Streptococcus suis]NQP21946.1 pyrroline-5-carboxylate reductase [Streptococcus suis]